MQIFIFDRLLENNIEDKNTRKSYEKDVALLWQIPEHKWNKWNTICHKTVRSSVATRGTGSRNSQKEALAVADEADVWQINASSGTGKRLRAATVFTTLWQMRQMISTSL